MRVSAAMRIDLEQFLALTMALGTAGAIGAVVYVSSGDAEPEPAPASLADEVLDEEETPASTAEVSPPPAAPAAPVVTVPAEPPPLPAEPDADFLRDPATDPIPAPQIESLG